MHVWARFMYQSLLVAVCIGAFVVLPHLVSGAAIHHYSDTISDSAPNEASNHTLVFTLNDAIPAGGFIRFRLQDGIFTIPAANFDIDNVEVYVNSSLRSASSTADATYDGISITTGTSGEIEYTLNSTDGIPSGATVRMLIGSHTSQATTTDTGITNPAVSQGYRFYIDTSSDTGTNISEGWIAIVENVGVGPVDTTETDPPVRFNGAPTGVLSGTIQNVQVSLETDEFAKCRYSTASGTPYFSMGQQFSTSFVTVHSVNLVVATSTSYDIYVRCIDDEGNINTDDYLISFSVPEYPEGEPGDAGSEEEEGGGSGTGTGGGTGSGSTSGDTSGGGSSGGGGSGGSGGSGSNTGSGSGGGGGFESTSGTYQSGDGQVIINGHAFPSSRLYILVDGGQVDTVTANSSGDFSATIDEIARGTYTFGVYAVDRDGTRSSTFSTSFLVTGGKASVLSNVNIMPSVKVSPDPVDPGQTLTISGYSIPDATVTIENQNDKSSVSLKTYTATSDARGAWSTTVDTAGFSSGTYKARAKSKSTDGTISTNYSGYTYYGVGQRATVSGSSDLNRDGNVNLVDFSILLFWWNTDGGTSDPPADINQDGRVSLTDFSIMIFNWTG